MLCRIAGAVMVLPGLGEAGMPVRVRAGVAVGLTVLVAPLVMPMGAIADPAPWQMMRLVVLETMTGLFIGWLARLAALALPIAGQFISLLIGLTSVIQPDPDLGAQTSALARLFSLAAPVLFLSSGLYALPLEALTASYHLIPIGAGLPAGDTAQGIIAATGDAFSIGLRLAAPFVLIGTVWQLALGVLSRFIPSIQPGAALMPGQVLGGVLLLGILIRPTLEEWASIARSDLSALLALVHG